MGEEFEELLREERRRLREIVEHAQWEARMALELGRSGSGWWLSGSGVPSGPRRSFSRIRP